MLLPEGRVRARLELRAYGHVILWLIQILIMPEEMVEHEVLVEICVCRIKSEGEVGGVGVPFLGRKYP